MFGLTWKTLAVGGAIALSTATTAFARVPSPQNLLLAQAPSFIKNQGSTY